MPSVLRFKLPLLHDGLPGLGGRMAAAARRWCRLSAQAVEPRGVNARFEERLRERERIARELHDTLLQGMHALILSLESLATRAPPEDPMYARLTETLRHADGLMQEGLCRIQNLRPPIGARIDLAPSLSAAWRELGGQSELRILVEGTPRALEPGAADEISLIGREALTNAVRHARAGRVEAQIIYDDAQLRLCIRDDGIGLDAGVLAAGVRSGHWGLQGMRERARCIRAQLDIWSSPGAGTEIDLAVPAAAAYQQAHRRAG